MSSVFSRKMTMSTFSGCLTGEGTPCEIVHGAQADVEVEHLAQGDVERADAAADGRGQRAFDADQKLLEGLDGVVGQPVVEFFEGLLAGKDLEPGDLAFAAVGLGTAASKTRTPAAQMSGPVPSPRMKGMMGLSGTLSLPWAVVILPPAGGVMSL